MSAPKTAALVAANLRRQIIRGDLAEGDGLPPEQVLAQQYRVSRPTLREALRILEAERLIDVHRGAKGGARVRLPGGDAAATQVGLILQHRRATLADVYEARRALESPAAAMMAGLADRRGSAALRSNVELTRAATNGVGADPRTASTLLHSFHGMVVAGSGNTTLALLGAMLDTILVRSGDTSATWTAPPEDGGYLERHCRAHELVVDRIVEGDAVAADQLWRAHLDDVSHDIVESVPNLVIDLLD